MSEMIWRMPEDKRGVGEGEYLGENGLIYCAACHTPRQCRMAILGQMGLRRIHCDCQEAAYLEKRQREKDEEKRLRIGQLRASGLQDRALHRCTFANDDGTNPRMDAARRYVESWPRLRQQGTGLLLWGEVGSGKTFLAGCIANALIDQGVPVLMTNLSRVLNAMSGCYSDERNRYVDSLRHFELLVMDDLGMERATDFALEQVFHVVDSRCRSGLPLIVTTNLPIIELRNSVDLAHRRIYSRVLECCVPLRISGEDRRRKQGEERKQAVRQALKGEAGKKIQKNEKKC